MHATIEHMIEWIAYNDEPTWLDEERVSKMISVEMVADLFGYSPAVIADQVIKVRNEWKKNERD